VTLDENQWAKIVLRYRRTQTIRKFLEASRLVWILDSCPYETHRISPRLINEEHRRNRLRNFVSWHNISRLQNQAAFRAGLIGLVTAPIFAGLTLKIPSALGIHFPIQMALIFLSGILFVTATTLYKLRVPEYVDEFLCDESRWKSVAIPESIYRTAMYKEFIDLGCAQEVTPSNLKDLIHQKNTFETAKAVHANGYRCFKIGFDVGALALIEKLLYRLSKECDFEIYEEYKREDGHIGLRKRSGPNTVFQGGDIFVRQLSIEHVRNHFAANLTIDRIEETASTNDIVVKLSDPHIVLADDQLNMESIVDGLECLLEPEFRSVLTQELSYMQAWKRPLARVSVLCLYIASLISLILFMALQGKVVLDAAF
jgi:hypothetical protein